VPYHVIVTPKKAADRRFGDALALDKDTAWVEERIARPWRQESALFIDGRTFRPDDIQVIRITETPQSTQELIALITKPPGASPPTRTEIARGGHDVTDQFITGPPEAALRAGADEATTFATNRKSVMVIYGHDLEAKNALFGWLRAIGLQPQEWNQLVSASGSASPYIGEVLGRAFQHVQAVVALFTPDEHVRSRDALPAADTTWRLQARPNVLIEAGMALITHPNRTVIVTLGSQQLPTDLVGRHYIQLSHTNSQPLQDLAIRLHNAGCDTDQTGTDWLDPGRFPNRDAIAPSPSIQHRTLQSAPSDPSTTTGDELSIGGDGVYLVGSDIQPGTYRTAGPADAKHGSCYYALLSTTNTQDIITNNNVNGPAVITVGPDVKAVHFSGCKPWHRLDTEA
jgi:predicted nucleotide-binding protein